ncbi:S8 family serine peptidase [bacterium]|nr:S8 family serine peptidase [bacterium]
MNMKRAAYLSILILFSLMITAIPKDAWSIYPNSSNMDMRQYVEDEIVVKFKGDYLPHRIIKVPKGKVIEGIGEYLKNKDVIIAQPNYIYNAMMVPNDPYYGYQWHLDNPVYGGIGMEEAWDIAIGTGVIVAVVDTGIRKGTDLANTSFAPGYDFYNNDSDPTDDNGHGTHVAGTIAQSTNNSLGVAGVAYNCTLMPVKVLGSTGGGTSSSVANGIKYAANHGADVINLSLGGPVPDYIVRAAVDTAYDLGVTIIAAAGNDGLPACSDPAAYDEKVIAVGATRYDETLSYYSNYGPSLDIVAPGGDTSVDQNGDGYVDGVLQQTFQKIGWRITWNYYFFQGTSMATPHVAGVAALLISNGTAATPQEVRAAIQETAEDLGAPGRDDTYGWGLVDAYTALNYAPVPNNPPVASIAVTSGAVYNETEDIYYGTEDGEITFDGSGSNDPDNDPLTYSWDFRDGSTSTDASPSHAYTSGGTYTVTLVVNDGRTGSEPASITLSIEEVNDPPVANAGPDQSVYTGDTVSFDGSGSLDIDGTIISYEWDFGDGSTGSGITTSHAYSSAEEYIVTLTVTDDCGSTGTDTLTVTVTDRPSTQEFTFTGTVKPRKENKHNGISVLSGAKSMYVKLTWTLYDDLRLRVYNPSGTKVEVDKSTSSNRVEETTIDSPVAGDWTVGAYNESISRSISYTIQVTVTY